MTRHDVAVIVAPSRPPDDPGASKLLRNIASTVWLPVFSATALVLALIFFVAAATACAWSSPRQPIMIVVF